MRARLIPIGNSRGIRLPKSLIEHYGFQDEVELEAAEEHLVVRNVRRARAGWSAAFRRMRERGDDELVLPQESPSEWDRKEWRW